jgi:hypothetical protein
VHPVVFYSRHGSKQIYVLDLLSKRATGKFDGKKAVTCLAAHPTKPLFASGHVDGSVRLWDYQLGSCRVSEEYNVFAQNSAKLAPSPFGITSLALGFDQVVAGSPIGLVVAFRVSGKGLNMSAARVLNGTRDLSGIGVLTSIQFHPKQEFFLTSFSKGKIQSWRLTRSADDKFSFARSVDIAPADYMNLLKNAYKASAGLSVIPPLREFVVRRIVLHPKTFKVAFSLEYANAQDSSHAASSWLHPVFELASTTNPEVPSLPSAASVSVPFGGFDAQWESQMPPNLFYVKRGQLMGYSIQSNENIILRQIPNVGPTCHTVRVLSSSGTAIIVMVEKVDSGNAANPMTVKKMANTVLDKKRTPGVTSAFIIAKNGTSIECQDARDAVFVGKDSYALLGVDGVSLCVCSISSVMKDVFQGWESPVDRLFLGKPVRSSEEGGLMYFMGAKGLLCFAQGKLSSRPFHPDMSKVFKVGKKELVLQLEWQSFGVVSMAMALVVTTERVLILNEELELVAQIKCAANRGVWCHSAVVFSRKDTCTVDYLCLDGYSGTLVSTDDSRASICALFVDKLVFVGLSLSGTQIKSVRIWPFECVAHGILGLSSSNDVKEDLLNRAMTSLDFFSRVSVDLLVRLRDAGFTKVCEKILGHAPSLLERMQNKKLWASDAAVAPPVDAAASSFKALPDQIEGWLAQKLDFYRGGSAMSGGLSTLSAAAPAQREKKTMPTPAGFVGAQLVRMELPSVSTSTRSSSLLSGRSGASRLDVHNSSIGTPVFKTRKPAPQMALPTAPAVATETAESSSPSASQVIDAQLQKAPVTLQVDTDEEEDEEDESSEISPQSSPLLGRQQSVLLSGGSWNVESRLPFVPRESNDSPLVLETAEEKSTGSSVAEDATLSTLVAQASGGEKDAVEEGRRLLGEAISLYDLSMLNDALAQAVQALAVYIAAPDPSIYAEDVIEAASYKILFSLLLHLNEVKAREDVAVQGCLLKTLAASISGVQSSHRGALIKEAITANTAAKNYRVVKLFISVFQKLFPGNEEFQGNEIGEMEKPSDEQDWCQNFDEGSLFCAESHVLITQMNSFATCSLCRAVVLSDRAAGSERCMVCKHKK